MDKEWANLWKIKTWMKETVCEYDSIKKKASANKKTVHFGRLFPICSLKGSELPQGHPSRKWKGRVVFQGNNVTDQESNAAVFQEIASSASSISAGKFIDAISCFGRSRLDAS